MNEMTATWDGYGQKRRELHNYVAQRDFYNTTLKIPNPQQQLSPDGCKNNDRLDFS